VRDRRFRIPVFVLAAFLVLQVAGASAAVRSSKRSVLVVHLSFQRLPYRVAVRVSDPNTLSLAGEFAIGDEYSGGYF